jgi:hypothetical protein
VSYPKIELHVHLEGTVRAGTLLQIARRNGVALLGVSPLACFQAGLQGALCDHDTRAALRQAGDAFDWSGSGAAALDPGQ